MLLTIKMSPMGRLGFGLRSPKGYKNKPTRSYCSLTPGVRLKPTPCSTVGHRIILLDRTGARLCHSETNSWSGFFFFFVFPFFERLKKDSGTSSTSPFWLLIRKHWSLKDPSSAAHSQQKDFDLQPPLPFFSAASQMSLPATAERNSGVWQGNYDLKSSFWHFTLQSYMQMKNGS